jgi:P-type E1-E2 ATPase
MKKLFDICSCVIVYRSSPEEKAQIIKFVMKSDPNAFTCAIGDGANDINMIQTAHIGVGIEGNEGNQAAYFCDYAIQEFQGIRRLILWHGRGFGLR